MNIKAAALAILPQPIINLHYQRQIEQSTVNDEPDIAVLPNLIKKDWVCFDIGANIGRYTKHLSNLSAKVLAVEPTPLTFSVLENNVRSMNMMNVSVHHCALSDHSGLGSMKVPNIYEAELAEGSDIQVKTLDELASGLERIDFIKCDTEGHEFKVVQGSKNVIAKFKPIWLIETNWNSPLFSLMESLGYSCYVEDSGNIRPRIGQERKTNYFFIA